MNELLAIIGIGCRLPGGADSPTSFWNLLCAGTDAISEIPEDRWSIAAHYDPTPGRIGKSISKWGGFLKNIDQFDAGFFGISAREADSIDPQQRLLLEVAWEAFEDGGQTLAGLRGSATGVFVGVSTSDYGGLQSPSGERDTSDTYSATGSGLSIAANRISYCLDLHGPSLVTDTACSSALTACHVACRSIWGGDCDMAVVAGVNVLLSPNTFIAFSRMSMLSPDGRCKAFDASANGFVRAEGVGAIILKRLSAAQSDGDRIYAVIRSTAVNQDGRSSGLTVPSQAAQEALIRRACRVAGIAPAEIGYVEAHGTGTAIGDPIEASSLGSVLGAGRDGPCVIGSVKTNIGHLEAASGIASLIKVALILKHGAIPPSLHLKCPNPNIDFQRLKLRVACTLEPFPATIGARIAAVNSFGFGGANAHAIVEAAPPKLQAMSCSSTAVRKVLAMPISARSQEALKGAANQYLQLLSLSSTDVRSLCAAAATRRSHLEYRLCVVGKDRTELRAGLQHYLVEEAHPALLTGPANAVESPVFVFAGQGSQWWRMGRELLRDEPAFQQKMAECDELLRDLGDWSLLREFCCDESSSRLQEAAIAQPAIFALQVSLAALWQSWGVRPAAVCGHSIGEVAAAHVAGVLSLPEAVRVIWHRGRCMASAATGGQMLAVRTDEAEAERVAVEHGGSVTVAAFNGPKSVTFSGEAAALASIAARFEGRGVFSRYLKVTHAFHSPHMDAVKFDLLQGLGRVTSSAGTVRFYSTVSGQEVDGEHCGADYWWSNVREPVKFRQAIGALIEHGHRTFLEISAHPTLTDVISESLAHSGIAGTVASSLRRTEPELATLLQNLAKLHVAGSTVDWKGFYPHASSETELPKYPWQHTRHWTEAPVPRAARLEAPIHPLLVTRLRVGAPTWNVWLDLEALSWLQEHRVHEHIVYPGAAYVEAALAIAGSVLPTDRYELENIEFRKPLFLPRGKPAVQLQSTWSPAEGKVTLLSRSSAVSGEWITNATAQLRQLQITDPSVIDLRRIKASLQLRLRATEFYRGCEQLGLFYGPAFRGIKALWRRSGEALGQIELPKSLEAAASQFKIHPALLDACSQVTFAAAPELRGRHTWLPARIDRLKYYRPPGKKVFCHATLTQASSYAVTCDFKLLDPHGKVLVEVEGYRAQAVRGGSGTFGEDPESWLYETQWIRKAFKRAPRTVRKSGPWVFFADSGGVATRVAERLGKRGERSVLIYPGHAYKRHADNQFEMNVSSTADLERILSAVIVPESRPLAGIAHLWSLDAPAPGELDLKSLHLAEAHGCHSLLHLVQFLTSRTVATKLWVVTQGAQPVGVTSNIAVAQSPIVGFGRTLINECPGLSCCLVDLGPGDPIRGAWQLCSEFEGADQETELAWRGQARFASRVVRTSLERHPPAGRFNRRRSGYRLEIPVSGVMDELALVATARSRPRAGEIEIEVRAAALNFRDVMKSLGAYPMDSDRELLLGDECSGRVVAVGTNARKFKCGDDVIANGAGCLATHVTVPVSYVIRKPADLSFEQAATVPVAFMTAWYALHELGKIRAGESILIHAGTGGVGLAAIQIAALAGAQIYATAGSAVKRAHLRSLGIRHVMDSRSTAFGSEIRRITRCRGVDLVLNSLAGEAIPTGISVLAAGGRFLEIGKRDVYANAGIGLRSLRNNISMFVIDMGQVMTQQPGVVQSLLQQMGKLLRAGKLRPLLHQSLPISQAVTAFRRMAQAKHMGKLVLTLENEKITAKPVLSPDRLRMRARASYMITGGLGGFGLRLAQWLIQSGARNLVLCGRSGAATPGARQAVAELRKSGARVLVVKADAGEPTDVTRLLKLTGRRLPPLRGIFHAAMVLDDGVLSQLQAHRFSRVMRPKVSGAWNLHTASASLKLDYFVMFSSVSTLLGPAGQANYVAANSFLDALAHYRRGRGLHALTVNWGALGEVGYLERNSAVAERLAFRGMLPIAPLQATAMLGRLLQGSATQIAVARVDWQAFVRAGPSWLGAPRFSGVAGRSDERTPGEGQQWRQALEVATPVERMTLVLAGVREATAKVLRASQGKLELRRPLRELGLDSLMAFELLNRLEQLFGVSLPSNNMSASVTVHSLAGAVVALLDKVPDELPAQSHQLTEAPAAGNVVFRPTGGTHQQIVGLRTAGTGSPLFLIHPAGGSTDIYNDLITSLPPGCPIYAIRSRVLAGAPDEWESTVALARAYAGLIGEHWPEGALRLAGFSVGGVFALATANDLERRGRTVSWVGMFDAPVIVLEPEHSREIVLRNLITEAYYQLRGEAMSLAPSDPQDLADSVSALARQALTARGETEQVNAILDWLVARGLSGDGTGDSSLRNFFQQFIRHAKMVRTLNIGPVNAPVRLWRAAASWLTSTKASPGLADRITRGGFTEEILSGRHFEIMHKPRVSVLAARLAASLAETER